MSFKQTQQQFINKSISIFGDLLDYSKVDYVNSLTGVVLICKKHREFIIIPKDHIAYKRGCPICSRYKHNLETFLYAANKIHGIKYNYDKVNYINAKSNVIIGCSAHGDFNQMPDKHINAKQGCPKCSVSCRKDLEYIIRRGSEINNGLYDYSQSIFINTFEKMLIICPLHGQFLQTPNNHINHKQRCPCCAVGKSKKEEYWLNDIGLPNDKNHRTVILHIGNKRFIVDGYNPKTNTIYEFYGDFWHGNPETYDHSLINTANHISYKVLYEKTLKREQLLKSNGYNIISIWENEYDRQNK